MATGSGIPQSQAITTSDITPTYAVPHDNAIASALGNLGDVAQGAVNDLITKHYETVGAAEGAAVAAGTQPYKDVPVITDVGKARQAAFQGAYLAGIKTDIDAHVDQTQRDNALNPAGFKDAAAPIVAGYVKNAPGPFAVQVQQYANAKTSSAFQTLSDQKLQHDQVTSVNGVNARQQALSDQLLGAAATGTDNTPEYLAAQQEWTQNNSQKVGNPLFDFSPEQAAAADAKQGEQLTGAVLTYHATQAYRAEGGEAGKQAAFKLLDEAISPGGALADLPPADKLKAFGAAKANIIDLDKADAESRAIAAEQRRQVQAAQRDASGTLALGLTSGTVSEADIRHAEATHQIQDGEAARLINGSRAQARMLASQDRASNTMAQRNTYESLVDLHNNGLLTYSHLATLPAGAISPTQTAALTGVLDKEAKPAITNITRIIDGALHDNGIQGSSKALIMENAAADAATYVKKNPGLTVGQQVQFAASWAKTTKGIVIPTAVNAPVTVMNRAQYSANLKLKFHGQSLSQSDVDSSYAKYQLSHPTSH